MIRFPEDVKSSRAMLSLGKSLPFFSLVKASKMMKSERMSLTKNSKKTSQSNASR